MIIPMIKRIDKHIENMMKSDLETIYKNVKKDNKMTEKSIMIENIKKGEFLDLIETDDMFTFGRKVKNPVSSIISIEFEDKSETWYINTVNGRLFTKNKEEYEEILHKLNNYEALKLYITNDTEVRTKYLDLFMKKAEVISEANSRTLTAINMKSVERLETDFTNKTESLVKSFEDKINTVYEKIEENNTVFTKTIKKLDTTIKSVGKINNVKLEEQLKQMGEIINSFKSLMD